MVFAHGRHRSSSARRVAVALALSALVHGGLAALAWVMSWWGFGGLSLPRREYAVEIVGVSADPSATPPLETPVATEEPRKPEKPEKPSPDAEQKADEPKVAKPKPRPKTPPDEPKRDRKDAKDDDTAARATPPPSPDDDGPAVTKTPADATPPGEDTPAIPWPLDEAEVAAASAVDLPGAAPGDAALLIAFRLDRLRDGPWAAHVERILAPMPDYQTIIAGSATPMAELFDLLFVATPDVTDVTATFLAAHHGRAEAELKATLAGPGKRPRVTWEAVPGGILGKRARGGGVLREDPRVFLIPEAGWIVLARPEHLPGLLEAAPAPAPPARDAGPGSPLATDAGVGATAAPAPAPARPRWMERLVTLVGDPKAANAKTEPGPTPGPIAILAVANLGKRLIVPGVGAMPAPTATVVSVFAVADGFRVVGVMDFVSDQAAKDFAAAATRTRDAALGSLVTRHFIAKVNGERALRELSFVARGKQVAASTHVLAADARVMLDAAADWSLEWFEAVRRAQGAK